ncbi:hypothetical protein K7X08_006587 [Anisodus acutangulus]|uniref:Uncharacterized protein n=1 Tax=Anisodus acutangulus TaxID=402998 RepID=A0A9Q1MW98_9SOLA|nr:hypothetical protein K7X08_006587 [Anisodus acutangulus]
MDKSRVELTGQITIAEGGRTGGRIMAIKQVESYLSEVEQQPAASMRDAFSPLMKALRADDLLGQSDLDVKVAVATCLNEMIRITAPDTPYNDDKMKDIFQLIVSSFENLDDQNSRSYNKRVSILKTMAKVRSCVVMLDLECDRLITEMFEHFFKAISVNRIHHACTGVSVGLM